MRIFAAASASGSGTRGTQREFGEYTYTAFLNEGGYPWVLISHTYDGSGDYLGMLPVAPEFALTDSGAYTVWKSGGQAELEPYLAYCLAQRERDVCPQVHISLDVIPGAWGRTPTEHERQQGMADSLKNGDALRRAGLPIMEVFHQYEPLHFLDELVERLEPGDLLGLSPRQGIGMAARQRWLDGVFHHLLKAHPPERMLPLHGLGVGGRSLIYRYPWWSVDSLDWVHVPGVFGGTLTRDGVVDRKTGAAPDGRSVARRRVQCLRFLHQWQRWSADLTTIWERRGVRWLHEPQTSSPAPSRS